MARSEAPGRGAFRFQRDPEAAAVVARPAGARHLEDQFGKLPALALAAHAKRLEQILGRAVIAVVLLDPAEHRELVTWAEMDLEAELRLVVNLLVELADAFVEARLPMALEEELGVVVERCGLRL